MIEQPQAADGRHPACQTIQPIEQVECIAPADDEKREANRAHPGHQPGRRRQVGQVQRGRGEFQPHILRRQSRGREQLPAHFHARADAIKIVEQSGEHHRRRPEEDAHGKIHLGVIPTADRHRQEPGQKHRHAAEIRHRLDVVFSLEVRPVHDAIAYRQYAHHGRQKERREKRREKHAHVRRDYLSERTVGHERFIGRVQNIQPIASHSRLSPLTRSH